MTDHADRVRRAIAIELVLADTPLLTEHLVDALVHRRRLVSARHGVVEVGVLDVVAGLDSMVRAGIVVPVLLATTTETAWTLRDHPRSMYQTWVRPRS